MKRFEDYTKQELVTLTSEEIYEIVDLECMIEGIQIAPSPGPKPEFETKAKPVTMFQAGGYDRYFRTMAEAVKLKELNMYAREGYKCLNDLSIVCPVTDMQVTAVDVYLSTDIGDQQLERAEYDRKKSAWESQNNAYTSYVRKREEIARGLYTTINAAVEEVGEAKERADAYATYLKLADGDHTIASRFFINMLVKQGWKEDDAWTELRKLPSRPTEEVAG